MRWECKRASDRQATTDAAITQPGCRRPGYDMKKGGVMRRRGYDGQRTRPLIVSFHVWPQLSLP
jgi:hypothetical protein